MAVMALINEYLSLNAVAMSDHVRQATLTLDAAALDATAMGDGWTKNVYGLKSGQLQVEFNDDTALSRRAMSTNASLAPRISRSPPISWWPGSQLPRWGTSGTCGPRR